MNKSNNQLIDFINEALSKEETAQLEQAIQQDADLSKDLNALRDIKAQVEALSYIEPPAQMDADFYKMLNEQHVAKPPKTTVMYPRWMKVAAVVALLAMGVIIGLQLNHRSSQMNALQASVMETKAEMASLMAKGSTSGRIAAVNVSLNAPKADEEMIDILINLLQNDQSTNVRLNAMEALQEIGKGEKIKQAFIQALKTENKAIVQIGLIHALVNLEAKNALPLFEKIIEDENHLDRVKDEARLGRIKML
ncbi:MAG: HEAT repeat domain-containing protein [Saprospiraceae bacterium]|nr:HEAT repeat domain-containing protein [Saprospiraceae bacterium]